MKLAEEFLKESSKIVAILAKNFEKLSLATRYQSKIIPHRKL